MWLPKKASFSSIIKDIKSLKIQGANNVAMAGIKALNLKSDKESIKKILEARPTEPCLYNSVNFTLIDLKKNYPLALNHLKNANEKIAKIGSNIIKKKSIVYTHCHSTTVTGILKKARKKKNFEVYNTETRPLYQGRKTAEELAKNNIHVTHFVDSAMKHAVREADLILLGCDSILSDGRIINKIGSSTIATLAEKYDTPLYICTNSWKFDALAIMGNMTEIEQRSPDEVWKKKLKNLKIKNPAFDIIDKKDITGIISEMGVLSPSTFMNQLLIVYPWIKNKIKL